MRLVQKQTNNNEVWLSSNAKPSARCSQHSDWPARTNPVFHCTWCGTEFCPACCGRTWLEFENAKGRVLWYRCPHCPIGLAFVMRAKGGPLSAEMPLEQRIVHRGDYEAWQDGAGACVLVLDKKDRYTWVQKPDAIYLMASSAPAEAGLLPALKGDYLLVDRSPGTSEEAGLFLYLQLPHGHQEYRLPQGWPARGEMKRLEVMPHVLNVRTDSYSGWFRGFDYSFEQPSGQRLRLRGQGTLCAGRSDTSLERQRGVGPSLALPA